MAAVSVVKAYAVDVGEVVTYMIVADSMLTYSHGVSYLSDR